MIAHSVAVSIYLNQTRCLKGVVPSREIDSRRRTGMPPSADDSIARTLLEVPAPVQEPDIRRRIRLANKTLLDRNVCPQRVGIVP